MVVKKIFDISTEKPEEVVLDLAKEIEAGWKIEKVEMRDFTVSVHTRPEPCCLIHLIRKENKT